jgi:hypothetical protein
LGAEYLPFIIENSKQYNLQIEKYCAAYVNLPTSTAFNQIEWNGARLHEIKALDNIVHNGAESHQQNEYYENFVKILDDVFPNIFKVIAQYISKYERIILTADHGASRLAVLANENELSKTLENPSQDKPNDWRFTKKPRDKPCPVEFEETLDGLYWVVKGYNRLPKQGGKDYELHGGATLEERLVPFIVFNKTAETTIQTITKPVKQIKERDDFDI